MKELLVGNEKWEIKVVVAWFGESVWGRGGWLVGVFIYPMRRV